MPKTLLLADDSVTIQKVVGISFANEDIEITTVDNGRDAVTKARAMRPDVILADVVMPGMSGYEVCEAVKGDPNLRHIPVLLLTGTFEAFDQARASAVGAAGHVAKPFEAQTLVDRVKQLLAAAPASFAQRAEGERSPSGVRPAPATAPAPVAVADDAFDFFSEEQPASAPPPVPSAEAFDLDGPDGAFAFGDDDLSAEIPEPLASPMPSGRRAPDATIAMLPDPPTAPDDAFEFSFDRDEPGDALREPVDPGQLAHTTLLDPAAGSGLDISSSDLDDARAPATKVLAFGDEGPQSLPLAAEDAELDLAEADPFEAPLADAEEPIAADPFETTMSPVAVAPSREAFDPFERDPFERDPFERESFEDAPVMEGEPLPIGEDFDAEPAFAAAPALADDADSWDDPASYEVASPAAAAFEAPAAAPPLARAELHDAIEKIAWDALGPITEKIVREAIARVEQVVWEVVPKLAETLIQEEIRRLKGGSS
jgi:CheY-like chemotaxis protein